MDKAALYAYVRGHLDQDTNTLPDTVLDTLTQAVEGYLNRALAGHVRKRHRFFWTLAAGKNRIPLPVYLDQIHSIKCNGITYTQYPLAFEKRAAEVGNSYVVLGDCIDLYPAPSEATVYTVDAETVLPSLTDDQSDTNWIAAYHADIYQKGLLAEAAGYLRDPQNEGLWRQTFQGLVEALRLQGWNEGISDVPRVMLP